jgi:hypothetical protein
MVKSGEVIWEQPKENPKSTGRPSPRSGHTITCLNEKAYFFGGCGVENGAPSVFNDMYLLHISEQFRFQKIDALGDVPSPRWRHTATLLPDNNSIFVFGGLCKGKRYNDSHIFDVARQEWRPAEVAGTPPHPRSHHTATLVEFDEEEDGDAEKKVFIIGGYGGHGSSRDFSMDVHAFDLDHWTWSAITRIKGPAPKPRGDHTVSVAGNLLILSGGRGSSTSKPAFSGYFDDVHVLDERGDERRRGACQCAATEQRTCPPPGGCHACPAAAAELGPEQRERGAQALLLQPLLPALTALQSPQRPCPAP